MTGWNISRWKYSGTKADQVDAALLSSEAIQAQDHESGAPVDIEAEPYLVRSGYLVPYFPPGDTRDEEHEQQRRERLNIELCTRVFRISDARDVSRRPEKADAAIDTLMQAFEHTRMEERRGIGRVLFGRITSRIRDLSLDYLQTKAPEDLELIQRLYHYVMVEKREIFECVRLYDHSIDRDGIIEEAFSEIGKTQIQSLDSIYANRVYKIGSSMAAMSEVYAVMNETLRANPSLPLDEVLRCLQAMTQAASRLVGIPGSDAEAYDMVAAAYVDSFDALHQAIWRIDHLNVSRGRSHKLAEWMFDGINLIHSMLNIRDARYNSIESFKTRIKEW